MSNKGYRKQFVFAAACIGMLIFGIVMISLGSILPEVTTKFQLSGAKAGSLPTLLPFGILIGSLVFGPSLDWLSYKSILIAGTLFTLLGLEGIVFSKTLFPLQLSVFGVGLGGGILNGATNALVSQISEEDHGANLSLLGVFFGVGALGTPAILGMLKGWHSFGAIFSVLGVLMVFPILFYLFIRFPKSAKTDGIPIKEGLKMTKDPVLLLFGFILFFQSGIEGLANNWSTTYLETIKELRSSVALFILSSFVGAITIARIVLSKILRIYSPLKVMVIGFIIAFAGCLLMLYGSSYGLLISGMVAIGIGMSAGFPVILGYIGQLYTRLSGTAFSIVITIALIGNVIANYLMGQVSQYHGTGVLPYFMMCALVLLLTLLFITNKKYHTKIN
mgnify:CR=1 FL=1